MKEYMKLAKYVEADLLIEDHGLPILGGHFEYEEGGCQGWGYMVDIAFLMRFMAVFGVSRLTDISGRSCWVVFKDEESSGWGGTSNDIIRIDPLHAKDGTSFDLTKWKGWVKKHSNHSAAELMGRKP